MQIKEIIENIEPGALLVVHASFKASLYDWRMLFFTKKMSCFATAHSLY